MGMGDVPEFIKGQICSRRFQETLGGNKNVVLGIGGCIAVGKNTELFQNSTRWRHEHELGPVRK